MRSGNKVGVVLLAGLAGLVLLLVAPLLMVGLAVAAAAGAGTGCTTPAAGASGGAVTAGSLTGEQSANAATIVSVALGVVGARLGPGPARQAAVIAVATAMQESTLRNLAYGDGDSVGLFQQRAPWGSFTDRTTPAVATTMFLTGGHGRQPGLLDIPGWRSMPIWQAAQSVQVSALPTAYAKWESLARTVVGSLVGTTVATDPTGCTGPGGMSAGGWVVPLPQGTYTLSSGFGMRRHPISGIPKMHQGQDLAAATGTPVSAAAAGRVTFAGISGSLTTGFGQLVVLDHGGGITTSYGHLSAIHTSVGQVIGAGEVIGAVGSTGGSTGPHLHFQIDRAGAPFDPVPWMSAHGAPL